MNYCDCRTNGPDDGSSRKLVVAFDGTENQYGPESSHVIEFYARVIKNKSQLSYYNSGIGTYVKPSRTSRLKTVVRNKWASLTAWNFKSNLLAGYRWLAEHYQDGDQIFLLGFSRGAYQARVLAAMIREVGLICTGNEEQIPFAFDLYKSINPEDPNATTLVCKFKESFCREVNIHFVGVWDTVSSVGLFRSKTYPGAESAQNICFFRHALALDERRVKFLPEYIVAPHETWFQQSGDFNLPRCKEVWFRGSHSDIGGGDRKNLRLDIGGLPSRWMAYEAMLAGLQLKPCSNPWVKEDIVGRKPSNSMSLIYRFIECVPFITWQDTSSKPFKVRSIPHRRRPRNIQPHQKIHISASLYGYADEDKRTIANLVQLGTDPILNWSQICSPVAGQTALTSVEELRARSLKSNVSQRVVTVYRAASASVVSTRDSLGFGSRLSSIIGKTRWREGAAWLLSCFHCESTTDISLQERRSPDPQRNEWLTKFELDWLDFDVSPILINGVKNGLNVVEFLERLNLIAHADEGIQHLRASPPCWELTLNLLKESTNDIQKAEFGIRLASKLIDSGSSHDGADYLELSKAVQAIERSACFSEYYRQRALSLLNKLEKHDTTATTATTASTSGVELLTARLSQEAVVVA